MARYQQPVLIYNPAAGRLRRDPQRILQRTTEALERAKLKPRFAPTSRPREAAEIARQALAGGADLILVLGGDGSINEVANGMAHSEVPVGILPAGTANVMAMELGIGGSPVRAAAAIETLVPRRIALGRLCQPGSSQYFIAMGGAGLDATIVNDVNPRLKAKTGKLAYWVAGFGQFGGKIGNLDARVNGSDYRSGFVLASRVRNYGGDLEIASGASLLRDDFEVVLFEGSSPFRYAAYMLGVAVKQVQAMRGVHTLRATKVELTGTSHLQVDGEYAGQTPASFEIVPSALTLLMPAAYG